MKRRMYIEIPGECNCGCVSCPSVHSKRRIDTDYYCKLLDDAKKEGFNWIGFCGVNPIIQTGFIDILTYCLKNEFMTRVYGNMDVHNLRKVPSGLLRGLQYTIILTEDIIMRNQEIILDRLIEIKQQYCRVEFAVKIVSSTMESETIKMIENVGYSVYLTQWWFEFWGKSYGKALHIPQISDSPTQSMCRDPESYICKASRDKVFVDQMLNLRACYMAKRGVANLRETTLSVSMQNEDIWGKWRTIRMKDMKKCQSCSFATVCHICPATLIEKGELLTCMLERQERESGI